MIDPLAESISLLRPQAVFTKGISGAGRWAVRYADFGHPSFCAVVEGSCRLAVDGEEALTLAAGDFVLLPTTPGFTLSGFEPATPVLITPDLAPSPDTELRHGDPNGPPNVRLLGGYFIFDVDEAGLLVSLLPSQIQIRDIPRLSTLVRLLTEESAAQRPGRELVLGRLVEILLVEALRLTQAADAPAGLLRGLGDVRLAEAIRSIHAEPARAWTMARLAREAALSRSAFFERFARNVGVPPMEYLLGWRMALAKDLLRSRDIDLAEIAERVGYGSASTFSTAFSRHVGQPPGRYARNLAERAAAAELPISPRSRARTDRGRR
ncbi:AraC family transcriptional regulator [Bosea sp. 62]|uniref:AraC family transcriptional regulator n=1 Tax=unclassified Bosea (in: a-proteobacteria) TaxID=2653178 RepID=UPI0012593685|nr:MULTISPECIES: AraC family transcriptional regulator [unclassified Bosea (in: a-proteobacteria)]CAD5253097.1 AraC family transcriptional regulator [Bosea sp. 7B]CAD5278231.1 AraC family transcriptional regulator [Bosea sp. 21B]CAD5279289.1 AraC family transcriptional regulator [Bosea sp. 46]VVT59679.1 AraC-type DNA-binding protein [Bosea sp. EC-HK365B]VXB38973.1 AraC family transcriptional regulator [Bosea sp. 62]